MVQSVFTIETFENSKFQWDRWVERLEGAFTIFNVAEGHRLHYLLHFMGPEAYDTLCDKVAPGKPSGKTYAEVVNLMRQYYSPAPLEIAENFRFHQRRQQEGENVRDFLTGLQKLAIHCKFENYLSTALRNQFVFGLRSEKIQNRLLESKELDLDRAFEIAVGMELSARDAAELHQSGVVHSVSTKTKNKKYSNISQNANKQSSTPTGGSKDTQNHCYRCGNTGHYASSCDKKNEICSFCNIKGHLRKVCNKAKRAGQTHQITEESDVDEIVALDELTEVGQTDMLQMEHTQHRAKFFTTLSVNDSEIKFEVDSGATVTVMSQNDYSKWFPGSTVLPTSLKLVSYCKTILKVRGFATARVIHKNREFELNIYIIENERAPLLGREWIRQLHLDMWEEEAEQVHSLSADEIVKKLIEDYPAAFKKSIGKIEGMTARLYVKSNARPVFRKARQVPFALKQKIEETLNKLENEGVLTKVDTSEWATPIVPVQKKNGDIRICGDFKITVNPNLHVDEHPLPTVDELFASMAGGQKFSKIDLNNAYLHLEIHPDDRHLLTLNTHRGLYRSNRLMFGVASAPAIWQREMEKILQGIPQITVFLDDIRVTGKTDEEHRRNLTEVVSRLAKRNLHINVEKSQFFMDEIEYCGYKIDRNGIHKTAGKIDAIQNAPKPTDKTQVRSFIGLVNYYGRFFENLSTLLFPLHQLLRDDTEFIWTDECERVFRAVKEKIQSPRCLVHFDPRLQIVLATDASPYGVGAVLSHVCDDGTERPIQFASQTFSKTQQKYSQIDKEAYAIIFGIRKFYQYLRGRRFTLYTDHKPLVQIFNPNKGLPVLTTTRMEHYAIYLQAFEYDIKYKDSKSNANADAISRLPVTSEAFTGYDEPDIVEIAQIETLPITVSKLARETNEDSGLRTLCQALQTGKTSSIEHRFNIPQTEFSVQQGCLLRGQRVVVPKTLRTEVLNELHTAHFGVNKMKGLARSHCWWESIDRDIENVARNCGACNAFRHDPPKVDTHPWEEAETPFERVHVDYAGPFYGSYYLILVDAYSRWPEIHVTKDMSTKTTIRVCREIFARFGIPRVLVSDNGRQFVSHEFERFLESNGVKHSLTAPYHPATNGLAERCVQTFKKSLRAIAPEPDEKERELCKLLLQYRKMPHGITNRSPSFLMFGREIKSRLDRMKPTTRAVTVREAKVESERTFKIGERVAAREYATQTKWQYGRVMKKREVTLRGTVG